MLTLALLLLLGPSDKPVYGWKDWGTQTVSFNAGEGIATHGTAKTAMHLKLVIAAELGVDVALGDCTRKGMVEGEVLCDIPEGAEWTSAVKDRRGAGTAAASAIGLASGNGKAADRIAAPNRVKIALLKWDCIANCSSAAR